MSRAARRFAFGVLACMTFARASFAQPPGSTKSDSGLKSADAERLFEEAKTLADANRWPEACARLASSLRIEPNMTTEFRLGDCYERIGKNASAAERYRGAAEAAAAAGDKDKEQFALERIAKLEPTIDKLVITPPDLPDVRVERDGKLVPPTMMNRPIPIDRGEHTVHVWAPGKASYDTLVTVWGRGATIRIDVPPLEDPIPWRLAPGAQVTSVVERPAIVSVESPSTRKPLSSLAPWGYGIGILGLAAVGGGVALYASAASDDNRSACADGRCVPGVALISAGSAVVLLGAVLVIVSGIER